MDTTITFKLAYDRDKDGNLQTFREKYNQFRSHIEKLQAKGILPRGEIRWSVEHKKPEPPPDGPAQVVQFPCCQAMDPPFGTYSPILLHTAGKRLDPLRIAI